MAFYSVDLARVHDEGFGAVANAAAPWILRRLGRGHRVVVELGCGGGRLAQVLVRRGFEVHGLDASPAFIRLARQLVPRGRFQVGRLPRAQIPRCSAVLAVGEVVNYFGSLRELRALVHRVHGALEPGGLFIFDATLPLRRPAARQRCLLRSRWAVIAEVSERRGSLVRHITTFFSRGSTYRRLTEVHRQRLWTVAQWRRVLREAGFTVDVSPGYLRRLNPRARVFVASRSGRPVTSR